ncbi:MAG: AAA family ATPase [Alphaproteobacteria bacterium]|nr:AAA family ATPase [Alphaproteobacteria bacterium]
MTCPRCHAEIFAGMRFCGKCSAPLVVSCERCGAENPVNNRFCGQCGAPLPAAVDNEAEVLSPLAVGELKRVTVLFCDIVESTPLTERLGAEQMRELIRWFLDAGLAEVHRYEGSTPQFTGDGFLALFGAPITHEDHVRRALLAALAIRDAVSSRKSEVATRHRLDLKIRIGIHTGLVVFGAVAGKLRMDPTVIGDAANVAARLQAAAEPGTILISEDTRRLAQGYARVELVGLLTLKGKGEPMPGYRLLGVSHRSALTEVPAASRPFVDRTSEMGFLTNLVRPAEEGRGRVVGIVGEPGIGKSRLIEEFRRHIGDAIVWVEGRCLSYATMVPYLLVLDVFRNLCGIADSDTPEASVAKLRSILRQVGMDPDEDSPLLLHLLGLRELGGAWALSSPEAVKAKAFETLRRLFIGASRHQPLALALEDLHWLDKISEEFLGFLAEAIAGTRILLVATYRPGYRPPWIDRSYAAQIPLEALSHADSRAVIRSVPARLQDPMADAIVAKAEGNPFFLEQLALNAGEARMPRAAGLVPDTIHDVVMARIDRLPDETKRLLQTASVIGREFSLRLLGEVWQGAGPVEPHLREVIRLEFIDEQADSERTSYIFHHALTQETAYSSLLERSRRILHGIVGKSLEKLNEDRTEVAERLAFHFGRSDYAEKAVDYAIFAGEKAQRRWATSDAAAYFDDALLRLTAMPDTEPNRLRRVDSVLKQAEVNYALGRYPEQIAALQPLGEIIHQCGDPHRRAAWHYWLGFLHSTSGGRPELAIEHCRTAAEIASASGLDELDAFAACCLAQTYNVAGRYRGAIEAGERALVKFEAQGNRWWAGRTLWQLSTASNYLGEWDASIAYCRRGLEHGIALEDVRLKSAGWYRMGTAYIVKGDVERGLECCNEALALNPIPRDAAWARVVRGYGKIKGGWLEEGIAELSEALGWFDDSHMRYAHTVGLTWLAEGHLRRGALSLTRPLIEQLLATTRQSGYLHYEGRAYWLLADCLAAEAPDAAEKYNETAIKIFEQIDARNDLGRAMLSRGMLRRDAGDASAARQLLRRAIEIFEALGTNDELLRARQALLPLSETPASHR